MSTAPIASTTLNQQLQQYFQTRSSDLQQLGGSLASGDLAGAQTAFNKITSLGQSGPFANGNAFKITQREQDFDAVGQALQSGNLAGAQQAFGALVNTFRHGVQTDPPVANATSSSSGPEVILNLSSASPEQITINVGNSSGGNEPVVSQSGQSPNAQQITLNLNPSSNEQIILNLLGAPSSSTSSPSGGSSSGLSVSA